MYEFMLKQTRKIIHTRVEAADLLDDRIEIKTSTIPGAGRGLFATDLIPKDACITTFQAHAVNVTTNTDGFYSVYPTTLKTNITDTMLRVSVSCM